MGFNLGAFAGGAAKGYSEGLENQRKQAEEKRRQDQADWEKKRRDDQEAFSKAAKEALFPEAPQAPQAPAPENAPSVVKVNANPYGPADGIASALPATPSAQDKLMPASTDAVQPEQPAAPAKAPYAVNGISMPGAKVKEDDANQATQGWGDAFAKNPDLFGDPNTMLKLGKLAMEYNQPDAMMWLERGHKAYKENAIASLQRLAGGDIEGAKQAFNASGKGNVDDITKNEDGTYQVTLQGGQKFTVDAQKELKSYLSPDHYFKTLNDERQLAEHERHNKEGEKSQGKIIDETRRHNVASEGIANKNADNKLTLAEIRADAAAKKAADADNKGNRLMVNDGVRALDVAYGVKRDPITNMVDPDSIKDKTGYYRDIAALEERVNAGEKPMAVAGDLANKATRDQKGGITGQSPATGTPKRLW